MERHQRRDVSTGGQGGDPMESTAGWRRERRSRASARRAAADGFLVTAVSAR